MSTGATIDSLAIEVLIANPMGRCRSPGLAKASGLKIGAPLSLASFARPFHSGNHRVWNSAQRRK